MLVADLVEVVVALLLLLPVTGPPSPPPSVFVVVFVGKEMEPPPPAFEAAEDADADARKEPDWEELVWRLDGIFLRTKERKKSV